MKNLIIIVLSIVFIASVACLAYAAGPTARVVSFSGDVKITPAGETTPVRCNPDLVLRPGDKITTGRNSYLKMAFDKAGGNVVKVRQKSQVLVVLKGEDKLELIDGELVALLKNLKKGATFQVRTPGAVCGARGTGWETKMSGKFTSVTVFDGTVYVRGIDRNGIVMKEEYLVEKGYRRKIKQYQSPGKERKVPESQIKRINKEIMLSKKMEKVFIKKKEKDKYNLKEKMYEKKLIAISNKIDSRAIARAEHMVEISPVRMDVIDVQIQMKLDRKADERRYDRVENRTIDNSTDQKLTIRD
jgi:hypothetical protein